MKRLRSNSLTSAQTALEYLLILTVVAIVVLASMKFLMPGVNRSSEGYFNSVTRVVLGEKPDPINGGWCEPVCPAGGGPTMYRTCECPAPAFGGSYCQGPAEKSCGGGAASGCVSDGSCSAPVPECGRITFGENNCHQVCTRQGPNCPGT